jgi:hypothetical protein
MIIAIPSKGRADKLATVKLLKDVDAEIFLFVEPQEIDEYSFWTKDFSNVKIININKNDMGSCYAKFFILDWMFTNKPNQSFWLIDDDIEYMLARDTIKTSEKGLAYYKMKRIEGKDIENALIHMEKIAKEKGYGLVSPVFKQNSWITLEPIQEIAPCLVFTFFNVEAWNQDVYDYFKNLIKNFDYKYTLYNDHLYAYGVLKNGIKTAHIFLYAYSTPTMSKQPGGCYSFYTIEHERECAKYISTLLPPGTCKIIEKRGRIEIKTFPSKMYKPLKSESKGGLLAWSK